MISWGNKSNYPRERSKPRGKSISSRGNDMRDNMELMKEIKGMNSDVNRGCRGREGREKGGKSWEK